MVRSGLYVARADKSINPAIFRRPQRPEGLIMSKNASLGAQGRKARRSLIVALHHDQLIMGSDRLAHHCEFLRRTAVPQETSDH